jgi:hypothetical protein
MSFAESQEPKGSGRFPFNYNGDYATERVLIMQGVATLTPDDGAAPVTLAAVRALLPVMHHA